jgi:Domain of unknown function (DUF4159)
VKNCRDSGIAFDEKRKERYPCADACTFSRLPIELFHIWAIVFMVVTGAGMLLFPREAKAAGNGRLTIARVIYEGGGDWYSNPSSLPNLLKAIRSYTGIDVDEQEVQISLKSRDLFNYPYLYINGHGNIKFSDDEVEALRKYLNGGGFLHADDNYGMDKSFRREIKKVFPEQEFVELPFDYPIYHNVFDFSRGLPKIHEHDGGPPLGLGIFSKGRLVVFYSLNTDLGDGWEDSEVHKDPQEVRIPALKMGVNIFVYALTGR